MPALDWFRPPRYVLTLSLAVTLAATLTLSWLVWKMLQQESALEAQRRQDRLESAADRAVSLSAGPFG
jgi:plasmid maintenance system antidote protein VapI